MVMQRARLSQNLIRVIAVASVAFACGDKGGRPDAGVIDATPPGGTVSLAWKLVDGNANIICEDVGAVTVKVVATPTDAVQGFQFSFDCTDLQGTSIELDPATYNLRIELLGSGATVLGDAVTENGVAVVSREDTGIGEVTFDVSRSGSLVFKMNTAETGGNCGDPGMDSGAGLTAVVLELQDAGGACIGNTSFEIDDPMDMGPVIEYTPNCADPTSTNRVETCIGDDWIIRIPSTASGQRRLVIYGYQGMNGPCYQGATNPVVLGGDIEVDLGERRLLQTGTGGCLYPAL